MLDWDSNRMCNRVSCVCRLQHSHPLNLNLAVVSFQLLSLPSLCPVLVGPRDLKVFYFTTSLNTSPSTFPCPKLCTSPCSMSTSPKDVNFPNIKIYFANKTQTTSNAQEDVSTQCERMLEVCNETSLRLLVAGPCSPRFRSLGVGWGRPEHA